MEFCHFIKIEHAGVERGILTSGAWNGSHAKHRSAGGAPVENVVSKTTTPPVDPKTCLPMSSKRR